MEIDPEAFTTKVSLTGHCVNMLRIVLMCNAETGVYPFIRAKKQQECLDTPHIFPDFQRNHQCKNFDAISDYGKTRKMTFSAEAGYIPS